MESDAQIIENMKVLGLSEYEVKAYISLLKKHPLNGYALSKNSGIPRSRIYEVLENLKSKQLVFEQSDEKSTLYEPLDPKLLLNKFRTNFDNLLTDISYYVNSIYSENITDNGLTIIKDRNKIIDFVKLLISNSTKRISVSLWEEELLDLSTALQGAINKGVVLKGIYFGNKNSFKELTSHRRIERYLSEKKERYMTVIIDDSYVISGIISRAEESQVTWTRDKGIIDMSEDYISHDIMVNVYAARLKGAKKEEYELFLDNVRKDYFGFTEEDFKKFK